MLVFVLFAAALFLAYSNGANDNFKGVATLFGSGTTSYRKAIAWATACTFAGSIAAIVVATQLIKSFSGKGLVPDAIANGMDFHTSIALAAGLTVILATRLGFPISTTHALTGSLLGIGLVASWQQGASLVNWSALQTSFALPLLLSPLIVIPLSMLLYGVTHQVAQRLNLQKTSCVCVGEVATPVLVGEVAQTITTHPEITIDEPAACLDRYTGQFLGLQVQPLIDTLHFLSAGVVSFARGLNDTPKMLSLMVLIQALPIQANALTIACAIALGGWLNARRVADTISQKVTTLNPGQGLCANLVTGLMVILASRFGLPVSTTHVSVGSIFGVGLISGTAHIKVFLQILASWVITLPIAAILSGVIYTLIHRPG
jgi:inorganic phosphate transporter, PiT family